VLVGAPFKKFGLFFIRGPENMKFRHYFTHRTPGKRHISWPVVGVYKVQCSGKRKFTSDKLHKTAIIVVINGANKTKFSPLSPHFMLTNTPVAALFCV
jgi:hypothetical protein